MKKILKIFIPLLILLIGGVIIYLNINENKTKYSDEEYKVIKEKVSNMDLIIDFGKNDTLFEIISSSDYKDKNLKKYIDYIKDNPKAPSEDILKIVNSNYNILDVKYNSKTVELIKEKYFVESLLEKYLNCSKEDIKEIIIYVNCDLDNDFYTNVSETNLDDDILEITNKYYKLNENYVPDDLVTIDSKYNLGASNKLRKEAYENFIKMVKNAEDNNLSLKNSSAYRSYSNQNSIYNNYVKKDGKSAADTYSARPGFSEHQTGLATDFNSVSSSFQYTDEYKWLIENSYKYGFILRYPKGKEYITGYMYEPWHYRYVGEKAAKIINEDDITFEEYYAYYIKNKNT